MTRVISILNLQAGGGKTTTALNLATALKRRGHNVLAVDLSPTEMLEQRVRLSNPSRYARSEHNAKIVSTVEGWHLMRGAVALPALHAQTLARATLRFSGQAPTVSSQDLRSLFDAYDYVLLDGSNDERAVLFEALALTDEVIVPLDSESLQFHDAVERLANMFAAQLSAHPQLKFGGVFLARYAPRFRRAREMLTALFNALGPVNCFSAYLRDSNEIRQAERRRASVLTDAPTSQAAHAFHHLAEQLTDASVPRLVPNPALFIMPGRATIQPTRDDDAPAPMDVIEILPTFLERAHNAAHPHQAIRYAVMSLLEQPQNLSALEFFETRLSEWLDGASFREIETLCELGEFLSEHGFDHYAAQTFRRALALHPNQLNAWMGLARVTLDADERTSALENCLALDEGMTAAEAVPSPTRPRSTNQPRTFVSPFASMQPATA